MSDRQVREIFDWGYTIVKYSKSTKTYVPVSERRNLIGDVQNFGSAIFNNADHGLPGDGTRLQLVCEWPNLPGRAARLIANRIQKTFPHLSQGDAQLLLSLANGHDQRPHTDMTAGCEQLEDLRIQALKHHIDDNRVPLSVIVTFAEESFLHVWPGSSSTIWTSDRAVKSQHEWSSKIRIPPYSALIFRQDLVHAGARYKEHNLRLHFYMDLVTDDYTPEKGHTFYVDKKFWCITKSSKK